MRLQHAALALMMLCAPVNAMGENLFQGVYDFVMNMFTMNLQAALRLIALGMASKPDLAYWPALTAIHDSLTWISGFFVVILTYQGLRYVVSADSPGGRANAKSAIQKLVVGMMFVAVNGTIFNFGLEIGVGLTNAFVGNVDVSEPALDKLVLLNGLGFCALTPIGALCGLLLLFMYIVRYAVILFLWALFPLILALYFSQIGYLARLGQRGVNLFVGAIIAGPIMGFLFKVSYDLLLAAASELSSHNLVNGLDPFIAVVMSLAGFLLAGLSPLITLGLFDRMAAICGMTTSLGGFISGAAFAGPVGAAAGAAAGGLVTSAATGVKDAAGDIAKRHMNSAKKDLQNAEEHANHSMRMKATYLAARKDYQATGDDRIRFMKDAQSLSDEALLGDYKSLISNGVVREDSKGRIQVGDAGKELGKKHPNLTRNYSESAVPHGNGFGDKISIQEATAQGLLSDGKIIMRNAAEAKIDHGGKTHLVTVNGGVDGRFNVQIHGHGVKTLRTVHKGAEMNTKEEVIMMIQKLAKEEDKSPTKILHKLYRGGR